MLRDVGVPLGALLVSSSGDMICESKRMPDMHELGFDEQPR